MILEFDVPDVDKEYERVNGMGVPIGQGLTTQEWVTAHYIFAIPKAIS